MTTEAIMEQALAQAQSLKDNVKKYEFARASCEMLNEENASIIIQVVKPGADTRIALMPLPEIKMQMIINTIRQMYQSEISEAEAAVKNVIKEPENVIKEPENVIKVPKKIIRESQEGKRKASFINEDFDAAVNEMIAESKENIPREEKNPEVAPVQQKRMMTKDIISDKELKQRYFKDGLTVKEIAKAAGVNESALYKRIEAMKKEQAAHAKECASSKRADCRRNSRSETYNL